MGGKNSFMNKMNPFAKESFHWQINPIRMLGKAGFETPGYRMIEKGEPFGTAFIKSGTPAQRAFRGWIRGDTNQPKQSTYQPIDYSGIRAAMLNQQNPSLQSQTTKTNQFNLPNTGGLTFNQNKL